MDGRSNQDIGKLGENTESLTLDVERLARALRWFVGALIITTFGAQLLKLRGTGLDLAALFDSDQKANVPTGYKILALITSAITVWLIARAAERQQDPWSRKWRLLAVVMSLLALDETASIHQRLSSFINRRFETSGALRHGWIVLYLPAAVVAACLLWRFALQLAPKTRNRFFAAALLFGGGSGFIEPLKSSVIQTSAPYLFLAATSDSLEEIGLAIFVIAALRELGSRTSTIQIVLRPDVGIEVGRRAHS